MHIRIRNILAKSVVALGAACLAGAQTTVSTSGQYVAHNVPNFVASAKNLGPANTAEVIDVAIWLKPHNRAELDTLTEELYDPTSSHYHSWLKNEDISTRFAPTVAEVQTVSKFLSSHNLPVVDIGPDNLSVRARGTLADVQKAFHVQINNFEVRSKNGQSASTYRANMTDPFIEGDAAPLVHAVYGLENSVFTHPVASQAPPAQHSKIGVNATATSNGPSSFISSNCFTGVGTESFSGTDYSGNPASAVLKGNTYSKNIGSAGCGYSPSEIWAAYNLNGLYKAGYDGTGQTIVIIDWCGSPSIESDANAFSARFGLPPLTKSNFHIYYPFTTPTCGAPDPEINIDVEWAHAIAPGAKIALVVPATSSFLDVDNAITYAIALHLGNSISGSYGSEELFTDPSVLDEENFLNELAAAVGISANYSSGDSGDFTFDFPSSYNPPSVSAPADSPYATAVGGVSLALTSANQIKWQTGWGTNFDPLVESDTISSPPYAYFNFGSGGGPSNYFEKPSFQKHLPGTQRLLPDISWLADPYTGGIIAITEPFTFPPLQYTVYGGTSLACPMFSALWAIANQEAGVPLGQAARHLYSMPPGTITDVLAVTSSTNVTAKITDNGITTSYNANSLVAPLESVTKYYSAIWDYPLYQDTSFIITFGTDSGLTVGPGWDDVTGLGTPNGKAFADYFNPAK